MHGRIANASQQALEEIQMDLVAKTLRQSGQVRLIARGCSMIPVICPGDLLTVRSELHSSAAVGDVVFTLRDGRFYIHRLLSTWREGNRSYYQTKGDALRQPDSVTGAVQLLGGITAIERHGKQIQSHVTLWNSCLAALVRRSEFITKVFLYCHSLRTRSYSPSAVAGGMAFDNLSESL
jgi:hypothetical protein